ncbi:N(4)-(beta-N-acetylglucosaminyl)-L-asparaginase [Oscillochloris sp. ZM17-4]|uniref:N(4)-(beta-N-acetylglucosaminyl)-L-asparaginase n=1 Tax=Oscillochloris sp. ZM17-4 TaxID=2866714 RepID=UPI001C738D09|nr:N(4)-(beta-N-acetylglucosaminyl)-L-asparaginase [Oscillochloris sp. ZM17-4]MBX0330138.1 N(4)-(beta-N-acetylglucosaminyl)-L-asparaginase [Oscillochloris sp. ZM17-4]
MLLIASSNGDVGMDAAWEILAAGGSALDAVEAGTRLVEDNPADHSVGYGGFPNLLGEVELDASIMDGSSLRAGAVGALRGYRYAITLARRVMDELPHVMLAGEGAARFAAELGMEREDLLTEPAAQVWREGIAGRLPEQFRDAQGAVMADLLRRAAGLATDPERAAGTVNFIAQDRAGRIASAVSTSGWAWKYPGRLGDSPIIGAGNYADSRYGAAACTGWGELAMRACTARSTVLYLRQGMGVEQACRAAFADLDDLGMDPAKVIMNMVAVDAAGGFTALSTADGRSFAFRRDGMGSFDLAPRVYVAPRGL